ncbi:MAG: potassium transporter TrkG, partial [Flavobacteriaceae bacterium]|nr:potassium transporter TrkG [Flavobacteriaceae bacterium]
MKLLSSILRKIPFYFSVLSLALLLYHFGYHSAIRHEEHIELFYTLTLFAVLIATFVRFFKGERTKNFKAFLFDALSVFLWSFVLITLVQAISFQISFDALAKKSWLVIAILLAFIRELSALSVNYKKSLLNPAQLFIGSFLFLIALGAGLLLMPAATYEGIGFVDALFTATSAVCVTGLIVVDTGTYFTDFGQIVIMLLFQLGGLGIMTFASYFSYFFKGGSTYENQLMFSDMSQSEKLNEVFKAFKNIILIAFIIELIGAIGVFLSVDKNAFYSLNDQIFFSVFHAVSGFCNAGFSTLKDSLYTGAFQFNYSLHLIIAVLFIIGGLGFPIVFNLLKYLKYLVKNYFRLYAEHEKFMHLPRVVNLNSRIVLFTTFSLIVGGTLIFYFLEFNNALQHHSGFGKWVTAFFSATTPRTAGFNTVDYSTLQFSTIMIILLLMWVGASPGSTGGGIKTSTFAIAFLNFYNLARGKERIEIFR